MRDFGRGVSSYTENQVKTIVFLPCRRAFLGTSVAWLDRSISRSIASRPLAQRDCMAMGSCLGPEDSDGGHLYTTQWILPDPGKLVSAPR
jgi:hypothetical protein